MTPQLTLSESGASASGVTEDMESLENQQAPSRLRGDKHHHSTRGNQGRPMARPDDDRLLSHYTLCNVTFSK